MPSESTFIPTQRTRALQAESRRLDGVVASLNARNLVLSNSASPAYGRTSSPSRMSPERTYAAPALAASVPAGGGNDGLLVRSSQIERRLNDLRIQNDKFLSSLTSKALQTPASPLQVAKLAEDLARMKQDLFVSLSERDQAIAEAALSEKKLRAEIERLKIEIAQNERSASLRIEAAESNAELHAMQCAAELQSHKKNLDELHESRTAEHAEHVRQKHAEVEAHAKQVLEEGDNLQQLIEEYVTKDEELKEAQEQHLADVAQHELDKAELAKQKAKSSTIVQDLLKQIREKDLRIVSLESERDDKIVKLASKEKKIKMMQDELAQYYRKRTSASASSRTSSPTKTME